jgi:hypothetical protein
MLPKRLHALGRRLGSTGARLQWSYSNLQQLAQRHAEEFALFAAASLETLQPRR